MSKRDFDPIHPGEILLEDCLQPMGISQYRLTKDISVRQHRISEITHGRRAISADTALRLGRYFGMEAQFWLNLQSRYDLLPAERTLEKRLDSEVRPEWHFLNRNQLNFIEKKGWSDDRLIATKQNSNHREASHNE